jgi:hypothetical protein
MAHRVQLRHRIEHLAPRGLGDPGRVVQVEHRRTAAPEPDPLITGRQEPARPQPRKQRLIRVDGVRLRQQDDKRRQVLVLAAQPVAEPRPHARSAGLLKPGLDECDSRVVIDRFRVHRLDDRDVVDDLRGVRQQFAHPRARLSVLRERIDRAGHRQQRLPHRLGNPLPLTNGVRDLRALVLRQRRLVIEGLEL